MAKQTLGEALREKAAGRVPAAVAQQWELLPEGIRPVARVLVDCKGSEPDTGDGCYNKPQWVIEEADGYHPTCLIHSGQVLNSLLAKYKDYSDVALYFHPYKGE